MPISHLVLGEVDSRLACGRQYARGERHTHAAPVLVDVARDVRDFLQAQSLFGSRAGDLLEQHSDAHTATSGRPRAVLYRDVVVGHDGDHVESGFCRGHLGGHLEVHHVAGVVLHDVQDPGAAVDVLGCLEQLVGCGGGEVLAGTRRVEHAEPDESAVQRLVAGAAAGDETDLAVVRAFAAIDDLVRVIDLQLRMRGRDSEERFFDDVRWIVSGTLPFLIVGAVGCGGA
jgi:hypothetical protein